ncbi:MAG: hypothetical protein RL213_1334 [Bacteroidota bacterium]|jgi:nicotinamide mononucleotide transporter
MEPAFSLFSQPVSWLELAAAVAGIIGVLLTIRRNILCFPVGIVNVSLYCYLFLLPEVRLYADALLQAVFCILLVYGWVNWKRADSAAKPEVSSMSSFEWKVFSLTVLAGAAFLGYLLQNFTDASLPWPDAVLTAVSLGAQWMVAKVRRENWWLWIAVNTAYIPLYIYKSLPLTAGLYLVFLLLAVHGHRTWKLKLYSHETTTNRAART